MPLRLMKYKRVCDGCLVGAGVSRVFGGWVLFGDVSICVVRC